MKFLLPDNLHTGMDIYFCYPPSWFSFTLSFFFILCCFYCMCIWINITIHLMPFHMFYVLVLECCVAQVQTAWDVLSRLTLSWQLCQNCKVKGEKRPVKICQDTCWQNTKKRKSVLESERLLQKKGRVIDRKEEWRKGRGSMWTSTTEWREVEERDLGLETGECQGIQKMNFDYSDSAEQKWETEKK